MVNKIAKIIYENQMGCSRKEAIKLIYSKENSHLFPSWENYKNQNDYLLIADNIFNYIKRKDRTIKKIAIKLFKLKNPHSKIRWYDDSNVILCGQFLSQFQLAQWEQDDYLFIADKIKKLFN